MFTLHAFATTTANAISSTALSNMVPVSDPVLQISGNFAYVPTLNNLFAAFGLGTNMTRLQLSSPSLLSLVPLDITPIDPSSLPATPLRILIDPASPIPLVPEEPLQALITATAGASNGEAFIFLSDGPLAPVSGKIIHARATAVTGASVKDLWYNAALSLTNQLAEGTYQLVGARVEGSHTYAFRFVFPGGTNATRPGGIVSQFTYSEDLGHKFRNGNLGVWGAFSNRVLPTMDFMSDGTSETVTVILDLIKTA